MITISKKRRSQKNEVETVALLQDLIQQIDDPTDVYKRQFEIPAECMKDHDIAGSVIFGMVQVEKHS